MTVYAMNGMIIRKYNRYKHRTDLEHALLQFLPANDPFWYDEESVLVACDIDLETEVARIEWDYKKYGDWTPMKIIFNRELPLDMKKEIIRVIKKYKLGVHDKYGKGNFFVTK